MIAAASWTEAVLSFHYPQLWDQTLEVETSPESCHPERSLRSEGSHSTAKSGPLTEEVIETNDWAAYVRAHCGDNPQTFVRFQRNAEIVGFDQVLNRWNSLARDVRSFAARTSLRMTRCCKLVPSRKMPGLDDLWVMERPHSMTLARLPCSFFPCSQSASLNLGGVETGREVTQGEVTRRRRK